MHRPTPSGGPSLPVAFANTVRCDACRSDDALATPRRYRAWARRVGGELPERIPADDLAALRRLRSAVTALLRSAIERSAPPRSALDRLRAAGRATVPRPVLAWSGAGWVVREAVPDVPSRRRVGEMLQEATTSLLTGPHREQLRACEGKGCAHFLLARTRGQRWCSATGCGNRARVARHYERAKRRRPDR